MHPTTRNNIAIEISNRLFIDAETCYYQFSVPTSDLDTKEMRYFWDVNVGQMTNTIITINNGTSLLTADDPITVGFTTGYRFQFTAENNQIFMAFTGSVPSTSSTSPLFDISIKLRSFELNPVKDEVEEEVTEPTDKEVNPETDVPVTEPDETDETEEPIDPPIIEPEKPIIPDDGEVIDEVDQEPEIVTEIEYVRVTRTVPNNNTIGEKSKNQKRKDQIGLTVLSAATLLGVIVYMMMTCCSKCIKKTQERTQIKTMNSFNTIEVSANPVNSHQNLHGNSEQHGLVRDDDDKNFFDGEKNNYDLDKDQARSKKMKISDAIQDQDSGKKKPASKKKKKKNSKKTKDADINMLNVE